MMRLEDIQVGVALRELEPSAVPTVVPTAEGTVQVVYKTPDGALKDRLLSRHDEPNICIATTERPWSFYGDGDTFKLAVEAKRIDLAFHFDRMMAASQPPGKACNPSGLVRGGHTADETNPESPGGSSA